MKIKTKNSNNKVGSFNNLLREKKMLEREQSKIKMLMRIEKIKEKR